MEPYSPLALPRTVARVRSILGTGCVAILLYVAPGNAATIPLAWNYATNAPAQAFGVGAAHARKPRRVRGKRPGVYVRLTPELKQDLDAFCARAGITMNAGISAAIAFLVRA